MAAPMTAGFGRLALKMFSSCSLIRSIYCARYTNLVRCMSSVPPTSTGDPTPSRNPMTVGDKAAVARGKKISQAMRSYLERSKAHETFMQEEKAEYEIGKRHLANIMGEDPDTFSQGDVDRAIQYLLPSGVFDKKARPLMRHPDNVIPKQKAAQFGIDGRPFHTLFYTGKPNLYELLHQAGAKVEQLQQFEDTQLSLGLKPAATFRLALANSTWMPCKELESLLQEKVSKGEYTRFLKLMERLVSQPYAAREAEFLQRYRKAIDDQSMFEKIPPLQYDSTGRGFVDTIGQRKSMMAELRVWKKGTGKVTVNGLSLIEKFPNVVDRQQILFPLQFCDMVNTLDIVATVTQKEPQLECASVARKVWSSQAGAVRLGIARALQSLVSMELCEKMRFAGLLTNDPRTRERKKPGQEGARRKFTWKKR